jgi:hypothetical protein
MLLIAVKERSVEVKGGLAAKARNKVKDREMWAGSLSRYGAVREPPPDRY